ncbi:MAG: hypothetical protein U0003_02585 [Vampirovibrionales bacterium]
MTLAPPLPVLANEVVLTAVANHLPALYKPSPESNASASWRIGAEPYPVAPALANDLNRLGPVLWQVQQAWQQLYSDSFQGKRGIPSWVSAWLDLGKPEALRQLATQKRFKSLLPLVLRPDILLTDYNGNDGGWAITELDSVPGGLGFTAALHQAYTQQGFLCWQSPSGFILDFWHLLESAHAQQRPSPLAFVAIVVSDESDDYRTELTWLANQLQQHHKPIAVVHPKQLSLHGETLCATLESGLRQPISMVYRFFELFDVANIPHWPLIEYAARKGWISLTPPCKPYLEEKLWWALWHHPVLTPHWKALLGNDTVEWLTPHVPRSWVVDPRPLPPHATIPHLHVGEQAIQSFQNLEQATQKERQLVLKPSGFSPLAWGSRGVVIGHDVSATDWAVALQRAQTDFNQTPWVLQQFHKPAQHTVHEFLLTTGEITPLAVRTRLCPYYLANPSVSSLSSTTVSLGGILATHCPANKKIIHGMRDGLMVPCTLTTPLTTSLATP